MASMFDEYIFLVGGEGVPLDLNKTSDPSPQKESRILNTVFVYSISQNLIQELKIENASLFKPRCALSSTPYNGSLYIFGGLEPEENFNNEFLKLEMKFGKNELDIINKFEFAVDTQSRCVLCKRVYSEAFNPIMEDRTLGDLEQFAAGKKSMNFGGRDPNEGAEFFEAKIDKK
jgi:hypothetical protein